MLGAPTLTTKPKSRSFPNLGDPPFSDERVSIAHCELVDAVQDLPLRIRWDDEDVPVKIWKPDSEGAQLAQCGIYFPGRNNAVDLEVVTRRNVQAVVGSWRFQRNWYYWSCETKSQPIPRDVAGTFNERWGREVRVDGCAGGQGVDGPISSYDIDSVEGLRAFMELLCKV